MGASSVSPATFSPPLRRFRHLDVEGQPTLFAEPPLALRHPEVAIRSALGAVLYAPATTPEVGRRLLTGAWPSVTAMVFCLEDAIADRDLQAAETAVRSVLEGLRADTHTTGSRQSRPFAFVRVRDSDHFERLLGDWGELVEELDGIAMPKIGAHRLERALVLAASARDLRRPLLLMPILEGPDMAHREGRIDALLDVRVQIAAKRSLVPSVRIGGTDLSAQWALRRPRDFSIYDIAVVRDIIADVVNVLGRDLDGPTISGAVWEYIRDEPVFKPGLRETPFEDEFGREHGREVRTRLLSQAIDGLVRETLLDRANGLHGKTIIHPSHALVVEAAHAVTYEEWQSAQAIIAAVEAGEGVTSMRGGTSMNEPKPHASWARRTVERARSFGVLAPGRSFLALLERDPALA